MQLNLGLPSNILLLILSALELMMPAEGHSLNLYPRRALLLDRTHAVIPGRVDKSRTFHRQVFADMNLPPPSTDDENGESRLEGGHNAAANESTDNDVICHPFGPCQPCPDDVMEEPFCQPFGNRKLVHCMPRLEFLNHSDANLPNSSPSSSHTNPNTNPAVPLPAYESCGRITAIERADFFEFVLTNIIFTALALAGVLLRTERMRVTQARRLAARIGVGLRRASSGNWGRFRGGGTGSDETQQGLLIG